MKKVLVFIDWYLPGYKAGGPIRSMANMIASLKGDYTFYVICRNSDYLESNPYPNTKPDDWNKLSENEYVFYINNQSLSFGLLKRIIKSEDYDLIYINGVYSFFFSIVPLILSKRLNFSNIIVAPRGMLSNQAFTAKKFKKKLFISMVRLFGLYKKIKIHVTSAHEKLDIELLRLKAAEVKLLPNLPPVFSKNLVKGKKPILELKLVSMARVSPEKNTLFALECLNYMDYKGKIIYDIFGSIYNKQYWKQCLEVIDRLPANVNVVYRGELNNEEVIGKLNEYHFLYLPSQGENFGHSILESFIAGCPVIISDTTPWLGLEEKKLGWDIPLKKELFIDAIQAALELNDENYGILAESCRNFAYAITKDHELKEAYKIFFGL